MDLAVQMADGMAAAHAAGFVHRDLKPANVLVTTDGRVKILDFGLAKSVVKPAQDDATQALTITTPGAIAGTATYMSPEQARGSANLDSRSDEFAFGVILHELATGKNPFLRETGAETLTAIIREDPEPLPASLPTQWFINPIPSPDATRIIYTRIERAGAEHLWMSAMSGGSPVRVVKDDAEMDFAGCWSADGLWFVFLSLDGGIMSLKKAKTNGQADPETLVAKVQPISLPVWSPKGDWILYSDDTIKLIAPDGKTPPRDLGTGLTNAICTFSADGALLYCVRKTKPNEGEWQLLSVNLEGKAEHVIGTLPEEPSSSFNPILRLSLAPDGKSVTFATYKYSANLWLIDGLRGRAPQ